MVASAPFLQGLNRDYQLEKCANNNAKAAKRSSALTRKCEFFSTMSSLNDSKFQATLGEPTAHLGK